MKKTKLVHFYFLSQSPHMLANRSAVVIFTFVLLAAGCATKHTPGLSDYKPLDSHLILSPVSQPANSAKAPVVIVKRDNGMSGMALSALFTVDGVETAKVPAGAFYKFQVEPGEHIFGVRSSKKGFLLPTKVFREVTVDCKDGKTYYLRLFVDYEEGIQIQRSSY